MLTLLLGSQAVAPSVSLNLVTEPRATRPSVIPLCLSISLPSRQHFKVCLLLISVEFIFEVLKKSSLNEYQGDAANK
jgi:hypothetical protein